LLTDQLQLRDTGCEQCVVDKSCRIFSGCPSYLRVRSEKQKQCWWGLATE